MRGRERLAWFLVAGALVVAGLVNHRREAVEAKSAVVNRALPDLFSERDLCMRRLDRRREADAPLQQAFQLLGQAGTQTFAMSPIEGSSLKAVAVVNRAAHRGAILVSALPSSDDQVFEVWIVREGGVPTRMSAIKRISSDLGAALIDQAALGPPPNKIVLALGPHGGSLRPEHPALTLTLP